MIRVRSVSENKSKNTDTKGEAPKTRDVGMIIGRQLKKKKDDCENFTSNTSRGFS